MKTSLSKLFLVLLYIVATTSISDVYGVNPADSIAPDKAGMREMTSLEFAKQMKLGWNLGNSLEAVGGETAWGNPIVKQRLIDSVKAAGFNTIRIPVAWSKFSDETNFIIQDSWFDRVEEVVNYALKRDMFVMINMHWDGGWMQPVYKKDDYVNDRMAKMWKQIAIRFRDYDDRLMFAGTNEVMVEGDYGTPTKEYYTVQNGYLQTFVTTVRATGGRNTYRHLIVQGFNTNIDHCVNFLKIPKDPTPNRLMVEVHYYDPYNFALNENSTITQWGKNATDPTKTETWANEAFADKQFEKMKTTYVDKGYPVIIGEYGTIARLYLGNKKTNAEFAEFRRYYTEYITQSIVNHGLVPVYWDNGSTADHGMGLFNRVNGKQAYPDLIKAINKSYK